jgi:hypothetical protein
VIETQGSRCPGKPVSRYFDDEHRAWRQRAARDPEEARLFMLPLASDRLIKDMPAAARPTD